MGIETPAALGGSEMSFVSSLIVIEELAKVDFLPLVSLAFVFLNYDVNYLSSS